VFLYVFEELLAGFEALLMSLARYFTKPDEWRYFFGVSFVEAVIPNSSGVLRLPFGPVRSTDETDQAH